MEQASLVHILTLHVIKTKLTLPSVHTCKGRTMGNKPVRVTFLVQPPNGLPITILSSYTNSRSTSLNTSTSFYLGNVSQMTTFSRICFHETFRSASSIAKLPGEIF
ncbi:hypothetical protein TNCV_1053551 [Trichonephila clavipes]|nr:hypothetical protein TNCV_1053551 [Trichonephila clavipes]